MNRFRAGLVVIVTGLVFSAPSLAQGGSNVTLEVKFYIPGGSVPTTTRVELSSGQGLPVGDAVVDTSGRVSFGPLPDGNYSVRASGPDIETATYDLRLMPDEIVHVESFQLRLVSQGSATPNPTSLPAVSALDQAAPPKARRK